MTAPNPTLRPLAARPYRPSNGAEGADFMESWCNRCQKDAAYRNDEGDSCPIVVATLALMDDDPNYPPEWIEDDVDGWQTNPRCTAFVMEGEDVGAIADTRQGLLDMTPTTQAGVTGLEGE